MIKYFEGALLALLAALGVIEALVIVVPPYGLAAAIFVLVFPPILFLVLVLQDLHRSGRSHDGPSRRTIAGPRRYS